MSAQPPAPKVKRPRSPSRSISASPPHHRSGMTGTDPSQTASSSMRAPGAHLFSCATCAKRKVRCDKKNPCTYCVTHGIDCVPTEIDPSKPRKRRFPEAELLSRIKRYESMLTKLGVDLDQPEEELSPRRSRQTGMLGSGAVPLHVNDTKRDSNHTEFFDPRVEKERMHEILCLNQSSGNTPFVSATELRQHGTDKGFDAVYIQDGRELLLFEDHFPGQPLQHPKAHQVFKIWQCYKDRVHPLVKLIHLPTVQTLVMDVGSDDTKGTPEDRALLFAVYSLSVSTLTMAEAASLFEVEDPDAAIHALYKSTQTALFRGNVWKSGEPSLFQALFAYLMATVRFVDPRVFVLYMGFADRLGRRNGLHVSTDGGISTMEREICRRAWWEFHCFDSRSAEKAGVGLGDLCPTVVPLPLYVNDSELHNTLSPGWTPTAPGSEIVFAAVRWETVRYLALSSEHLRMSNDEDGEAAERSLLRLTLQTASELEERLFTKIINPASRSDDTWRMAKHFATYSIARIRMWAYVQLSKRTLEDEMQILHNGLIQLENDRLWKVDAGFAKFGWYSMVNLPMPAYIHVLNLLKKHTTGSIVDAAWRELSMTPSWLDRLLDFWRKFMGYARFNERAIEQRMRVFQAFQLKAWEARASALKPGTPVPLWIQRLQREAKLNAAKDAATAVPAQTRTARPFSSALGEYGPIRLTKSGDSTGTYSSPTTPLEGSSHEGTSTSTTSSTHHATPPDGFHHPSSSSSPHTYAQQSVSRTGDAATYPNQYMYHQQTKSSMPPSFGPASSNATQSLYGSPSSYSSIGSQASHLQSSSSVGPSNPSSSSSMSSSALPTNPVNFLNDFSIIPSASDPNGMNELLQLIQGDLNIDWTQWLNSTGAM